VGIGELLKRPELIASVVVIVGVVAGALWFTRGGRRAKPGPLPSAVEGTAPQSASSRPPTAVVRPSTPTHTFADIAGLDQAVAELREVKDYLSHPARFEALGAHLPGGILLHGPPGCGKTLLAKALAGETGVPFFSVSAAAFVEQYVGLGAARVRELFEQAKRDAPSIVFVDELDAVGRSRDVSVAGGREFDNTLNQLLVELDGFESSSGVLILGATNRPELIDPALLRPGRFDRRIRVDRPDRRGREQVLRLHAASRPFGAEVNWSEVAGHTAGLTASELATIVNEASLLAARQRRTTISRHDLYEALDRHLSGMPSSRLMYDEEKALLAVHESGHALLSLLLRGMQPPARVSIVTRGGRFDTSPWSGRDEGETLTKRELLARLIVLLGGRAAELLVLGEPSTNAEDDLKDAASLARGMVERWAMTGRYELASAGRDGKMPYLEGSAGGEEVRGLVAGAESAAREILSNHRPSLTAMADALADRETLTAAELSGIHTRAIDARVDRHLSRVEPAAS
jgi:cell division protease FtsH